jgi:hypothetical protein
MAAGDLLFALCKKVMQQQEPSEFADSDGGVFLNVLAGATSLLLRQLTAFAMLLHEEHIRLLDQAEQQQQQQVPAVSGQSSSSSSSSQLAEPGRRQPSKQRFCADQLDVRSFHLEVSQQTPLFVRKAYLDAARTYEWGSAQEKWLLYSERACQMVYVKGVLIQLRYQILARSIQQPFDYRHSMLPSEGTAAKVVLELQLLAAAFVQRQQRQGAVLDDAGPAAKLLVSSNRLLHDIILAHCAGCKQQPTLPQGPTWPQAPTWPQGPTLPQGPTWPQQPTLPQAPTWPQQPTLPHALRVRPALLEQCGLQLLQALAAPVQQLLLEPDDATGAHLQTDERQQQLYALRVIASGCAVVNCGDPDIFFHRWGLLAHKALSCQFALRLGASSTCL